MRTAVVGLGNPEGLPELDLGLGNVDRLLLGEEDVGRGTLGVEGDGLLGGLDAGGRVPLSPGRLHDLVLGLT